LRVFVSAGPMSARVVRGRLFLPWKEGSNWPRVFVPLRKEKQELDSSFRWNDALKSKGAGFRLSPE